MLEWISSTGYVEHLVDIMANLYQRYYEGHIPCVRCIWYTRTGKETSFFLN
jgi:hypothetical protein